MQSSHHIFEAESVGSGTGLPPIQGEITEEEEDQEKADEVFDDEGKGLTKESTYPDEEGIHFQMNLPSIALFFKRAR